jgi:uncharacterized YccA/Bax inhibitor family protein
MFSIDPKIVEDAISQISSYELLNPVCERSQKEAERYKRINDEKKTKQWVMAAVSCLAKQVHYIVAKEKEEQREMLYDPPILLSGLVLFLMIVVTLILFTIYGFRRCIGMFFIFAGLLGFLVSVLMKTHIHNIYNIGLLSEQRNLIIIASIIFLAGIVLQALLYVKNK